MRGKLMRPVSRASKTSTASSVKNFLDDFDNKSVKTPKKTAQILFGKSGKTEYDRLARKLYGKKKTRDADMCAVKIQSTWKMYRVRCHFKNFFSAFQQSRRASYRSIFSILVLNSTVKNVDRRACLTYIQERIGCTSEASGSIRTDNETFAITGLYSIPEYVNPQTLTKFVKTVYRSSLSNVLSGWRLATRTGKRFRHAHDTVNANAMGLAMFKSEFVCFHMWRQYVRFRHPNHDKWRDKIYASVPHWNNFHQKAQAKARLVEKADNLRQRNIKENVVQALRFLLQKRKQINSLNGQVDKYKIRRNMKFALAAWMRYIVVEQNKVLMKKVVLRKWLQTVQKRKHMEMIANQMTTRHEYWLKRKMMDVFYKIRKVQPILSTWSYLRMQRTPALALYFVNVIRKDEEGAALTRCFNSWVAYIRRKRRWHHFVFKNTVVTEYTPLKKRVLAGFRKRPYPYLPETSINDCDFKCDTMDTYMEVMRDGVDPNSIFMIYEGDEPIDIQPPRNKVEQRENFFKVWQTQEADLSLFMRAAVIYCAKKQAQNVRETEGIAEKTYLQYKKAMAFLAEMNLASDGKFGAVQRTIQVNNKRNIGNRQRCIRRDKLLMLAHHSHSDAVDLHVTKPVFIPEDQTKVFERIRCASDDLVRSFEPLLPLSALGSVLEQPNESSFICVTGCKSKPTDFRKTITDCHNIIKKDIIRSEIGPDSVSRFDRFFGSAEKVSVVTGGVRSNVHTDPYSRNLGQLPPMPRPKTGISAKLLDRFPMDTRKPQIIGRQTGKFTMNTTLPVEDLPEEDRLEDMGSQHLELLGPHTSSTFFSGMNSFASLLTNASQAVLKLKKKKKAPENTLEVIEDVIEEAVEEEEEEFVEPVQVQRKPRPKTPTQQSAPTINATEIDQSLVEGFDETTLLSLRKVKDLKSPRSAEKYKMFLEILFGKSNKDQNNVIVNNIRRKIVAEYRSRKAAQSACGLTTTGIVRPVTNVMEKFRKDRKIRTRWTDADADDFIESISSRVPLKPEEEPTEMECVYNSRKFRPIPKPENAQPSTTPAQPGTPAGSPARRVRRRQRKRKVSVSPLKLDIPESDPEPKGDNNDTILNSAHSTHSVHSTHSLHSTRSTHSIAPDPDPTSSRSNATVPEEKQATARSVQEESYEYEYDYEYWDEDESDASFREDLMENATSSHVSRNIDEIHGEEEQNAEVADTDFDAAAISSRTQGQQQGSNHMTRFETATPYTSVRGDGNAIQRVNKIAFRILEHSITEDGGLKSYVDIDNDVMPSLNLKGFVNNNGPKNPGTDGNDYGPKYRMRNFHKAQIQRNKQTMPIVTPGKREITNEMKKAINEEGRFAGLRYDEGKSITRRSRLEAQRPYTPVYKLDKKADRTTGARVHFDDEAQVVSFKSGTRQQGSGASNFMPVRISSTKQRAITKPLHTTPKKADTRQSRPESQMSKTRNCYTKIANIVNELIRMMAVHNDQNTFEAFRVNARLTRKKPTFTAFDEKSSLETTEFYSQIQSIYVQYASHQNLRETASHLIKLAKSNQDFAPVLIRSLESAVKEKTTRIQEAEKHKVVDRSNFDPNLAAQYVDISWMTEAQLRYKAVAIQYSEASLARPNSALDAVIESTVPSPAQGRSRGSQRPRTSVPRRQEWDDVIRDYDLNEMMLVTPCVVPEREVDDLLAIYRKSH